MKNNRLKITLYIIFFLILICTTLSLTYAYYTVNYASDLNTVTNVSIDNCVTFEITDIDNESLKAISISGDRAVPISDDKALSTSYYSVSFTVKNVCSNRNKANIYIVTASDSNMPLKALRTAVYSLGSQVQAPTYLTPSVLNYGAYQELQNYLNNEDNFELTDNSSSNKMDHDNVKLSGDVAKIAEVSLPSKGSSQTYTVYLWIGEGEGTEITTVTQDTSNLTSNTTIKTTDKSTVSTNKITVDATLNSYMVVADFDDDLTSSYVSLFNLCAGYSLKECTTNYIKQFTSIQNIKNIGGMYRYVGYNDNQEADANGNVVDNNYICFGADDVSSDCTNEDNLYRIIGITSNGYLKIQKYKAYSETSGDTIATTFSWYSSNADMPWTSSSIYNEKILNNYYANLSDTWKSYIQEWQYTIGQTSTNYTTYGYSGTNWSSVPATDLFNNYDGGNNPKKNKAYVGLIYASDYALSNPLVDSNGKLSFTDEQKSWMYYERQSKTAEAAVEWTMSYYGSFKGTYTSWVISKSSDTLGQLTPNAVEYHGELRPVVYLKNTIKLSKGNGSKTSPYIISLDADNLADACEDNTIQKCITENKGSSSDKLSKIPNLSTSLLGGMYRYQGYSESSGETTNVVDNNYVCFNTTTACTNKNYLYRIIGITKNGNIKLQKSTSIGNYAWYTDNTTNISGFEQSTIYSVLNGSSGAYYSTIGSEWLDMVENWTWYTGNTYLGTDNVGDGDGHRYWESFTANDLYAYEIGARSRTVNDTVIDNIKTYSSKYKFSLFSPSDYAYAILSSGDGSVSVEGSSGTTSWIFNTSTYEWTNVYTGLQAYYTSTTGANVYTAWHTYTNGNIFADSSGLTLEMAVRPVFYLKNSVKIVSGSGTSSDPYILGS